MLQRRRDLTGIMMSWRRYSQRALLQQIKLRELGVKIFKWKYFASAAGRVSRQPPASYTNQIHEFVALDLSVVVNEVASLR